MKEHRPTPPWLFALTGTPYGVPGAFTAVVTPYLAARAGADLELIGLFVSLLFIPPMVQFLFSPIVDFGPRRKYWLLLMAAVGAICLFAACQMKMPEHTWPFIGFAFLAQLSTGLIGCCNGGLMATGMTDAKRGKAGGWYNVGNLAGGGLSGALAVYMTGHHYSATYVGAALATMMVVPALAALAIDEPPRTTEGTFGSAMRKLLREIKDTLWNRAGITGILLCLSPVGTAALANYFSGMAKTYVSHDIAAELAKLPVDQAAKLLDEKVSDLVAFVTGPVGQILTAAGALFGGFICDRTNRRAMYLLSGVLTAIVGLGMAFSPPSQMTFTVGGLLYALVTGFCYAAFTATVLETMGKDSKSAATRYSLFTASGNFAIWYVGLIDTRFASKYGVNGVVASDAVLNIAGVVVLGLVFWKLGSFGKSRHVPEPELPVAKVVDNREEQR